LKRNSYRNTLDFFISEKKEKKKRHAGHVQAHRTTVNSNR